MTEDESKIKDTRARRLVNIGFFTVMLCAAHLGFTNDNHNWSFGIMMGAGVFTIVMMRLNIKRVLQEEKEARNRALNTIERYINEKR